MSHGCKKSNRWWTQLPRNCFILILLFLGLSSGLAFSETLPCRFGLGTLWQLDPRFRPFALFSVTDPKKTFLCGPTCYLNGLHKFRRARKQPPDNAIAQMVYLVYHLIPDKVGLSPDILKEHGIWPFLFFKMAAEHLKDLGLSAEVSIWGIHTAPVPYRLSHTNISTDVLFEANRSDTVVILNYVYYAGRPSIHRINPLKVTLPPNKGGSHGAHYVVLAHVQQQKTDPHRLSVVLQDPVLGYMPATLVPVRPRRYGVQTYQVFSKRKDFQSETILLSAAIRIRLKPETVSP